MARSRRSAAPAPALDDALLALNAAPIDRASICRLALDAEAWVDASTADVANGTALAARLGVPARTLAVARTAVRAAAAVADAERAAAAALGARVLTGLDADYPAALRHLPLPPPVLYCRGMLPACFGDEAAPAVAIVGSRHPTAYGREAAWLFGRDVARAGVVVVSGFARGVDAAAHRGALAGGGTTIAVLGCGVDVAYPAEHHPALADEVAAHGALLAELPLGTPPRKLHFPVRNRLIAALTRATVVVEAAMRSGSLITARCALDLGRDVLALPGRIFDDTAMGANALLADGARPALHPRDVLAALGLDRIGIDGAAPAPDTPPPLPGLGARLWEALPVGAVRGADELASRCAAPIDETLAELLELELAGWIARLPGPLYCRRA
jgi:DNA processing protein